MVRKPAVAGQFYSAEVNSLRRQIAGFIKETEQKTHAKGILLPHAGYIYSGRVAAEVVSKIIPQPNYIILGPNHTGLGEEFSIMPEGTWQMPMGDIEINSSLAQQLLKESSLLKEDTSAHLHEHSIEVELPFLQYINPQFQFVPIVLGAGSLENYKRLGIEIASVIKKLKRQDLMIIASSDMTHYESQRDAQRKDKLAIDAILKLDPDSLWQIIRKEDISMCGYAPCIAMLSACKELGATKAELVMYQTSGDTTGDKSSVVGYAGIIVN